MNPYSGATFIECISLFLQRLFSFQPLVQDEIQLYTLSLIAISSAIVGTFLVLRKMCMLANSLSHTILTGIVSAFAIQRFFGPSAFDASFSQLLASEYIVIIASLLMAFLTIFLTDLLISWLKVKDDAATGIVFSCLFSAGILLVTLMSRNAHIGAELMMGNADALTRQDLILSLQMAIINTALILIFFRPLFYTTFDPVFSQVIGIRAQLFRYLLMAQLAITAIAAFRAVGVLMVIAFIVTPPLIARRLTSNLTSMIALACAIGVGTSCVSVALSRHMLSVFGIALSTSALTVVVLTALLTLSFLRPKKAIINS